MKDNSGPEENEQHTVKWIKCYKTVKTLWFQLCKIYECVGIMASYT